MALRNKNASPSDQTRRAEMHDSINAKYSTPLTIAAAALLAFPFVEDLSNMGAASYFGLAAFAVAVSVFTLAFSESMRRN